MLTCNSSSVAIIIAFAYSLSRLKSGGDTVKIFIMKLRFYRKIILQDLNIAHLMKKQLMYVCLKSNPSVSSSSITPLHDIVRPVSSNKSDR